MIAAKLLAYPALCRHLTDRKIPFVIAEKFCKEVDFELNGKRHLAIGFENKCGGFELRNEHFKGSSSPKDVNIIEHQSSKIITVFGRFFSFLFYQTLHQKTRSQLTSFFVLSSLSFFEKRSQTMEKRETIHLYLDLAGKIHT